MSKNLCWNKRTKMFCQRRILSLIWIEIIQRTFACSTFHIHIFHILILNCLFSIIYLRIITLCQETVDWKDIDIYRVTITNTHATHKLHLESHFLTAKTHTIILNIYTCWPKNRNNLRKESPVNGVQGQGGAFTDHLWLCAVVAAVLVSLSYHI